MVTEVALAGAWDRSVEGEPLWLGHGADGTGRWFWVLYLPPLLWWGRAGLCSVDRECGWSPILRCPQRALGVCFSPPIASQEGRRVSLKALGILHPLSTEGWEDLRK